MKKMKVKAEIYSRVAGYFRPVSQWNNGKKEEFVERKVYIVQEFPDTNYRIIKTNCRD